MRYKLDYDACKDLSKEDAKTHELKNETPKKKLPFFPFNPINKKKANNLESISCTWINKKKANDPESISYTWNV